MSYCLLPLPRSEYATKRHGVKPTSKGTSKGGQISHTPSVQTLNTVACTNKPQTTRSFLFFFLLALWLVREGPFFGRRGKCAMLQRAVIAAVKRQPHQKKSTYYYVWLARTWRLFKLAAVSTCSKQRKEIRKTKIKSMHTCIFRTSPSQRSRRCNEPMAATANLCKRR